MFCYKQQTKEIRSNRGTNPFETRVSVSWSWFGITSENASWNRIKQLLQLNTGWKSSCSGLCSELKRKLYKKVEISRSEKSGRNRFSKKNSTLSALLPYWIFFLSKNAPLCRNQNPEIKITWLLSMICEHPRTLKDILISNRLCDQCCNRKDCSICPSNWSGSCKSQVVYMRLLLDVEETRWPLVGGITEQMRALLNPPPLK